jgi:pilus assembly protein Flp/PilA
MTFEPVLSKEPGAITMKSLIVRFAKNESGATAIEYGLIASLIAVVIIGAATTLGTKLSNTFTAVSNQLR